MSIDRFKRTSIPPIRLITHNMTPIANTNTKDQENKHQDSTRAYTKDIQHPSYSPPHRYTHIPKTFSILPILHLTGTRIYQRHSASFPYSTSQVHAYTKDIQHPSHTPPHGYTHIPKTFRILPILHLIGSIPSSPTLPHNHKHNLLPNHIPVPL